MSMKIPTGNINIQALKAGLRGTASKLALATALLLPAVPADMPAPTPVPAPDYSGDNPAVAPLRLEFARTLLGRQLLELADKHGVTVDYEPALGALDYNAVYLSPCKTVLVNPAIPMEEQVISFAHEIRHTWQDTVMGYTEMQNRLLTPLQHWVLRRTIEADALAYSAYFWADRAEKLDLRTEDTRWRRADLALVEPLRAEIREKGYVTLDTYRRATLEKSYAYLVDHYHAPHQNMASLGVTRLRGRIDGIARKMAGSDFDGAEADTKKLYDDLTRAPHDDAFMQYLRGYGGLSLLAGTPTALADTGRDTMFNVYARPPGFHPPTDDHPQPRINRGSIAETLHDMEETAGMMRGELHYLSLRLNFYAKAPYLVPPPAPAAAPAAPVVQQKTNAAVSCERPMPAKGPAHAPH